jgi:hypothetical protein
MCARDSTSSPQRRSAPRAGAPCYRETVRLLVSLSKRHSDALRELAAPAAAARTANGMPATRAVQLGEQVGRLEDVAVSALARLARISDYKDALEAMQESGSVVWLWGTILNRAAETTDAARMSRKR